MSDCPNCDALNEMYAQSQASNNALQASLVEKDDKLRAAKGEITKLKKADAVPADIREVFVEWQRLCDYPDLALVDSRRDKIAARLNDRGSSVEKVKRAIYGFSRFPYATPRGWQASGTPEQLRTQIKTILKDGEQVDEGVKLAARADREDGSSMPGETPWPVDLFDPDQVVVPGPHDADRVPLWIVPAACHGDGKTLKAGAVMVRWGGRGQVRVKCVPGCDDPLGALERLRDGDRGDQMDLGTELAA